MASELKPWRYEIKYGPDGEDSYSWVYDDHGAMVATMKTHKAKQIVDAMNTRPAPADDEVTIPRNPTEAMMDAGLYHCSHDMEWSDLYTAWQAMFDAATLDGGMTEQAKTSPAPAATDTGLMRLSLVRGGGLEPNQNGDYIRFSQAEELLAVKDAQADAYGIALMMIREGCGNPSEIAQKALERFGK